MHKGIDCATPLTRTSAQEIAQVGYEFAARYLVPPSYAWKRLTRSEAEAITDAGMSMISVFETSKYNPSHGASQGKMDGQSALQEAQLIKQPKGSAIYFAVDYDAQPREYDAIENYLRAAEYEIAGYKIGVYGSFEVVEEMSRRIQDIRIWQTYAWSHGHQSPRANLYQWKNGQTVAGVEVDFNESYGEEGSWNTKLGGGLPKMSPEDAEKIIRFLSAGYMAMVSQEARDEFNRLANEVRKAAGIPVE
jgi:hypothetical protein